MIIEEICNYKYRPQRFPKPVRSFVLVFCLVFSYCGNSQNILTKTIDASAIETISIQGNQIFNISVVTSKTNLIDITSTLDGEYQSKYQIITEEKNNKLTLRLEFMSFEDIPDNKRNAHKVIAATLHLKIPENLNLNIHSDVGSADVAGNFNMLSIELSQGYCNVNGLAKNGIINTIDGNISVVTKDGKIIASSKNGKVVKDNFNPSQSLWNLKSINGDITVAKKE
ncbi:hypothetical protein [Winogradskyella ouciana]|uniref:hypothetical protein n=1 Tax=Winogradskyella ouciana TaxID=2608631 RepID=UPI003D26B969